MRRQEEQRRKFHEALINMLYPPQLPPDPSAIEERNEYDDDPANILPSPEEEISAHEVDEEKSCSDGGGDGKLTRAQRKRLRKRKLKEESTRRGKMIGPLLPVTGREDAPETVREKVPMNCNVSIENEVTGSGEDGVSCGGKNKVKQRRKARKLAKTLPEESAGAGGSGHKSS